jgi:hypothetical protein
MAHMQAIGLERKQPSGKVEVHLLPDAALSLEGEAPKATMEDEASSSTCSLPGETEVEVVGAGAYRYQNDKVVARTHAFDDALVTTGERLAERFGFPAGMGSMHVHGDKLYCVARVCVKDSDQPIDELGIYLQSTVGSGQPRTR